MGGIFFFFFAYEICFWTANCCCTLSVELVLQCRVYYVPFLLLIITKVDCNCCSTSVLDCYPY